MQADCKKWILPSAQKIIIINNSNNKTQTSCAEYIWVHLTLEILAAQITHSSDIFSHNVFAYYGGMLGHHDGSPEVMCLHIYEYICMYVSMQSHILYLYLYTHTTNILKYNFLKCTFQIICLLAKCDYYCVLIFKMAWQNC